MGYSVNEHPKGPKDFMMVCQADGSFNRTKDTGCFKVNCGLCPSGDKYKNSRAAEKVKRHYGEKCHFQCDIGYTLDAQPSGKSDYVLTCLPGGEFSEPRTCMPVDCGMPPPVKNAKAVTKEAVMFPGFAKYEVNEGFTLTGKAEPNQFFRRKCQANGLFSDIIVKKPKSIRPRPEKAEMQSSSLEARPIIEPVPCGMPPKVENAVYDENAYVFGQVFTYVCYLGFTLTGKSDGDVSADISCSALGEFTWKGKISPMPKCLPVECGAAPDHKFATLLTPVKTEVVTAASPALVYECKPGYSTKLFDNPYDPQHRFVTISCSGSGKFTPAEECVNIQDCGTYHCGPHGECEDVDSPTAKPVDNYNCKCAAGYEQTLRKGSQPGDESKECTTINDCPTPAEKICGGVNSKGTRRGLCRDLLQGYSCQCAMGYKSAMEGKNETCVPVECGEAPKVEHAQSPMDGQQVTYDTPPWNYTCEDGYSVNGNGPKQMRCRCSAGGELSTLQRCLPVSCGSPHSVDHTTLSPQIEELFYPAKLTYTADEGYSVTGKSDGEQSFEVACQADGKQTELKKMLPIECGTVPTHENAKYDEKRIFVYEEKATVTCDEGYSIDGTSAQRSLQYELSCQSTGEFTKTEECIEIPPTTTTTTVPDCGKAPEVKHAYKTGSPKFGRKLTYEAIEGYSLDGSTSKQQKKFEVRCTPGGDFSTVFEFKRIECGPSVDVSFTKAVEFIPAAGAASFLHVAANGSAASSSQGQGGLAVSKVFSSNSNAPITHKTYHPLFGDMVKYTCMEGYRIPKGRNTIYSRDPTELTLKCESSGEFVAVKPTRVSSFECVPVNCFAPKRKDGANFVANLKQFGGPKIEFGNKQPFECLSGYTLNGKPTGETDYVETCQENGRLTSLNKCTDIDWCLISKCGEKRIGKCIDGLLGYSCQCRPGFEVVSPDGFHQRCVPINECITQQGDKLCAGGGNHGVCQDGVLKYQCKCVKGYENKVTMNQDSCTAVFCPSLRARQFSTSAQVGAKMQYLQTASYKCKPGYTVDGKKDGPIDYTMECLDTGEMNEVADCKPLACDCGDDGCIPSVKHATANASSDAALKFGEVTEFTCEKGYTTSGNPTAPNTFVVSCTAEAKLTKPGECLPVECGLPPRIPNSVSGGSKSLVFKDTTTIECRKGYTTTGKTDGAASFSFECLADGKLKGAGSCVPVSCGAPKKIKFAQHPLAELVYPGQFEVLCESGYSLDSDPNGESTFVGSCNANGSITGLKECKPVTCGKPMAEEGSSSKDPETFLGGHATWNCLAGYSTDGTATGDTSFKRQCLDHGHFGKSSPSKCMDIDFCIGNPCTSNGLCTDLGKGVVGPGYSCACFEGYQTKQRPDGSETCSEDLCGSDPCGSGGTCTDLSNESGIDGAYTCECEVGYELDEFKRNHPSCLRTSCGKMPTQILNVVMDGRLPKVDLETHNKKPPEVDNSVPILKFGDKVTYTCADGYSTDGKFSEESLSFSVRCESSGRLSQAILGDKECTLIRCDNWQRPVVGFSTQKTPSERFYEYGDVLLFECDPGYTTTGKLDGPTTFEVQCRKDGTFTEEHDNCLPIHCNIPEVAHSIPSSGYEPVLFSTVVLYSCMDGYVAQGMAMAQFAGVCGAKGQLEFSGASECTPVQCGTPETQPNADLFLPADHGAAAPPPRRRRRRGAAAGLLHTATSSSSVGLWRRVVPQRQEQLGLVQQTRQDVDLVPFPLGRVMTTVDSPVIVKCHSGYNIGGMAGGIATYSLQCQTGGKFVAMMGNVVLASECEAPNFQVRGVVTDAQSASVFLDGALLEFSVGGKTVATTKTDPNGLYTTSLSAGTYHLVIKRSGYIDYEAELAIVSSIAPGGAGDAALSKVLAEGEWRVTLTWAAHSEDLDSHTYLGRDAKDMVYFSQTTIFDPASGITVTLDRDDTDGFGPETTTFKGIGGCTRKPNCLVKFMVDNYTPEDGDIGASEAIITLYKGTSVAKKYVIPKEAADARIWPVFTLDATEGATEVLFDGDQTYGPTLLPMNDLDRQNWGSSFDSEQWSKFEDNKFHLLVGFKVEDFTGLHRIQEAAWAAVDHTKKFDCHDIDFFEASPDWSEELGWSSCGAGYFLAGFFRTGDKWDEEHGPHQITKAHCCKPEELPKEWGSCHKDPLFSQPGWSRCKESEAGKQTLMVGLKMKYGSDIPKGFPLKALREAKCCELPGGGMVPNPEPVTSAVEEFEDGYWHGEWEVEEWTTSEEVEYESGWW